MSLCQSGLSFTWYDCMLSSVCISATAETSNKNQFIPVKSTGPFLPCDCIESVSYTFLVPLPSGYASWVSFCGKCRLYIREVSISTSFTVFVMCQLGDKLIQGEYMGKFDLNQSSDAIFCCQSKYNGAVCFQRSFWSSQEKAFCGDYFISLFAVEYRGFPTRIVYIKHDIW